MSVSSLPTRLSIVIPAYQEEARLGRTLVEVADVVAGLERPVELIVVDDGSTDRTVAVASAELHRFPAARVIRSPENRGKGHAVRVGMLAATGDLRLFMDADGSTDLGEVGRFVAEFDRRPDPAVLIASIGHPQSQVTPQPWIRQLGGRVANRAIRLLVLPGIADTQRGFKLFPGPAADALFAEATVDGWLFDVEVLALARFAGWPVVELPVRWEHREASRVTAASYLTTLVDLLRIRLRLWRDGHRGRAHQPRVL